MEANFPEIGVGLVGASSRRALLLDLAVAFPSLRHRWIFATQQRLHLNRALVAMTGARTCAERSSSRVRCWGRSQCRPRVRVQRDSTRAQQRPMNESDAHPPRSSRNCRFVGDLAMLRMCLSQQLFALLRVLAVWERDAGMHVRPAAAPCMSLPGIFSVWARTPRSGMQFA